AAVCLLGADPGAVAADARPMDPSRLESRWVAMQVIRGAPGTPEVHLSEPALAWYEVGPEKTQRTVRVPGLEVERVLMPDRHPVDGSFSDFVWIFDVETGDVLSASLSGELNQPIRLGPLQMSSRVSIAVDLNTFVVGGYTPVRELGGQTMTGF